MRCTFSKDERLSSKKIIDELFRVNKKIYSKNFTIIWDKKTPSNPKIELLISVPKKNIKKASDRNYVKRMIRESYRINKPIIYSLISVNIYVILVYNKKEVQKFNILEKEIVAIFDNLSNVINESV